jgi:hypothetical protein
MKKKRKVIRYETVGTFSLSGDRPFSDWKKVPVYAKTPEEKLIERMVRRCMNHLKCKDYELGITKRNVEVAVKCTRVVDKEWCSATYGGSDVIQINLAYWQHGKSGWHEEYAAFDKCPVIGGRYTKSLEEDLWMSVAHEVAHHVQRKFGPRCRWLKKTCQKPHGQGFKDIYSILRSKIVNPKLGEYEPKRSD